ncbi:MAG: DUF11 domain-containing protein [Planctomycetota bacterium]
MSALAKASWRIPQILIAVAVGFTLLVPPAAAQSPRFPGTHSILNGQMPPGFVSAARQHGRPGIAGYVQPVRVVLPAGVQAAMPVGGSFDEAKGQLDVGLVIGGIYRFRITNIPRREGAELFPTLEIIDRTYPPQGLELKYPIRVDLSNDDLRAALGGRMVTRVIYLEDQENAVRLPQGKRPSRPFESSPGEDSLQLADQLGRPVAILRIGSMLPPTQPELAAGFYFGYPTWYPIHQPESPANTTTRDVQPAGFSFSMNDDPAQDSWKQTPSAEAVTSAEAVASTGQLEAGGIARGHIGDEPAHLAAWRRARRLRRNHSLGHKPSLACQSCPEAVGDSGGCGPFVPMQPTLPHPGGNDPNEFICNGGDRPPKAIVQQDDRFGDLDIADTVAHFTTGAKDIEIAASNPVCIYAPRFQSVRKITGAVEGERAIGLSLARKRRPAGGMIQVEGNVAINKALPIEKAEVSRRIDGMRERTRGVPVFRTQQVVQTVDNLAALANIHLDTVSQMEDAIIASLRQHVDAAVVWTSDTGVQVDIGQINAPEVKRTRKAEGFTVFEYPAAGRLEVLKLADPVHAAPGETVRFVISIRNVGDSPVSQVTLADNLSTRLKLIEDSQECSVEAEFDTRLNEAGSLRLRWVLQEPLPVGQSVLIRFECTVL